MEYNQYQPTRIEEAYAYYLILTVFPSSFKDHNAAIPGAPPHQKNSIHISGKYMVPFLSKSNISRSLLRDIWSLIDPSALGYISTIQPQFVTMLRYVSIVQNQLGPTLQDDDDSTSQNSKDLLEQCFIQSCHRTDLTLAQFDGYTLPPPHELLLLSSASGPHHQPQHSHLTTTTTTTTNDDDPFASISATAATILPATMETYLPPQKSTAAFHPPPPLSALSTTAVTFDSVTSNTSTNTTETTTPISRSSMDVWGAFDGLATVEDAPLPTLSSSLPSAPITSTTADDDEGDANIGGDFGDFHDPSTALTDTPPLSHQQNTIVEPIPMNDEESDGFGDFVAPSMMGPSTTSGDAATNGWGALDALVDETTNNTTSLPPLLSSINPMPTPAFTSSTIDVPMNEFSVDGQNCNITSTIAAVQTSSNDGWDALASLSITMQAMGTNSDQMKDPESFQSLRDPFESNPIAAEDESEGFGDFVGPYHTAETLSVVELSTEKQALGHGNGWDALDLLVASSTAPTTSDPPIPPCGEITKAIEEVGDEFFGDFAATNVATNTSIISQAQDTVDSATPPNDTFVPIKTIDRIKEEELVSSAETGWDALNALASVSDIPVPPLPLFTHRNESVIVPEENDDFGDFVSPQPDVAIERPQAVDTAATISDIPEQTDNTTIDELSNLGHGWDALDALTSTTLTTEISIPSLQPVNQVFDRANVFDVANEGIADFVSPKVDETSVEFAVNPLSIAINVPPHTSAHHTASEMQTNFGSGWDAFDALVSISDIPISPLQSLSHVTEITKEVNESESEGFGDFIGTTDLAATNVALDDDVRMTNEVVPMSHQESHIAQAISDPFKTTTTAETTHETDINHAISFNVNDSPSQKNTNAVGRDGETNGVGNGSSGWDVIHELSDVTDAQLGTSKDMLNGHQLQELTETAGKDIGDDFGDFVGEDGDISQQECNVPSATVVYRSEPTSNPLVDDDPFNILASSDEAALSRPVILYDRADSAYYSAQTKSVSSDTDYDNFDDAMMNDFEVDGLDAQTNQIDATNTKQGDDPGSYDNNDPFSLPMSDSAVDRSSLGNQHPANDLAKAFHEDNTDDFGAFTDFQGIPEEDIGGTDQNEKVADPFSPSTDVLFPHYASSTESVIENDDFGEFETVNFPVTEADSQIPNEAETQTINDDEFGSFNDFVAFETSIPIAPSMPSTGSTASSTTRAMKVGLVVECDEDWNWTRDQIILKASNLPKNLNHTSHGMMNFGACFDSSLQRKFPLSESRIHQILRSANLMDRLSSSHGKELSSYWAQLLTVIKKELLRGEAILTDAANLNPNDFVFAVKNLKKYVRGLKEYVRVSRFITASLADLFMLDVFTMLSSEALTSSFQSHTIAIEAYEIEQLWEKIYLHDEQLCLGAIDSTPNRLEDVVEIRSRLFDNAIDAALCDFTLQPLPTPMKIDSKQTIVVWSDKTYIACAANLLSNTTDYFTRQSRRLLT